jgi:hypothetical protein
MYFSLFCLSHSFFLSTSLSFCLSVCLSLFSHLSVSLMYLYMSFFLSFKYFCFVVRRLKKSMIDPFVYVSCKTHLLKIVFELFWLLSVTNYFRTNLFLNVSLYFRALIYSNISFKVGIIKPPKLGRILKLFKSKRENIVKNVFLS